MNIDTARRVLLWCTVIKYGILLVWFLTFMLAHDWMYQLHGRWFRLSVDQFDMLHYGGISIYKLGIILLNLVPYIALHYNQAPKLGLRVTRKRTQTQNLHPYRTLDLYEVLPAPSITPVQGQKKHPFEGLTERLRMMLLFLAPPWPSNTLISYILSAARVIDGLAENLTPRKNLLPMGVSAKQAQALRETVHALHQSSSFAHILRIQGLCHRRMGKTRIEEGLNVSWCCLQAGQVRLDDSGSKNRGRIV